LAHMKSEPLKDTRCQVRMSDKLYKEAEKVAESYGTTVSTLARFLIHRFILATNEHGSAIEYPPVFVKRSGEKEPAIVQNIKDTGNKTHTIPNGKI